MGKKNLLYEDEIAWEDIPLAERLEYIRAHLCTGPCAQAHSVLQKRHRMNTALREAIEALGRERE